MKKACYMTLCVGGVLAAGIANAQDFLLIPDSTADRIVKVSAVDGSVINSTFITDANNPLTYDFGTPIAAIQVGAEIWISDQTSDAVFRFNQSGTYLSKISGGLDNIRGLRMVNGEVWVTNAGTLNSAPGTAIVRYSTSGSLLGSFAVGDPFDVIQNGNEVLIANIAGDDIDRYSLTGTFLGKFHDSDGTTGIDFPEQIAADGSGFLVAGFSAPIGLYRYDSAGAQTNYWSIGNGNRGIYRLGNGRVLYTDGDSISSYDTVNEVSVDMLTGGSFRFIHAHTTVPEPATLAALGIGALALLRRRKKA